MQLGAGSRQIVLQSPANQQQQKSLQQATRPTGNTINLVNQCPTFDVGHKQDILIASGSERELTIKVKNMPQFKVSNTKEYFYL